MGYGAIALAVTGKPGEERTARSTGPPQDGRSDHARPRRRSGYLVTHPYQRAHLEELARGKAPLLG
jgi:hypothetical protein